MFKALRTPRRIILSGTPIQNDLSEFHAMVSFFRQGTCFTAYEDVIYRPISVTLVCLVANCTLPKVLLD